MNQLSYLEGTTMRFDTSPSGIQYWASSCKLTSGAQSDSGFMIPGLRENWSWNYPPLRNLLYSNLPTNDNKSRIFAANSQRVQKFWATTLARQKLIEIYPAENSLMENPRWMSIIPGASLGFPYLCNVPPTDKSTLRVTTVRPKVHAPRAHIHSTHLQEHTCSRSCGFCPA